MVSVCCIGFGGDVLGGQHANGSCGSRCYCTDCLVFLAMALNPYFASAFCGARAWYASQSLGRFLAHFVAAGDS